MEQHIEGVGQMLVRLLTGNFEEAVAARKEERPPQFRDCRRRTTWRPARASAML